MDPSVTFTHFSYRYRIYLSQDSPSLLANNGKIKTLRESHSPGFTIDILTIVC